MNNLGNIQQFLQAAVSQVAPGASQSVSQPSNQGWTGNMPPGLFGSQGWTGAQSPLAAALSPQGTSFPSGLFGTQGWGQTGAAAAPAGPAK